MDRYFVWGRGALKGQARYVLKLWELWMLRVEAGFALGGGGRVW
jgi:hypothetical protein